jgi:pilus assembly protein Flp/PilA
MVEAAKRFLADESGASAIEYGLLAAAVGIGLVYSLINYQIALTGLFGVVGSRVPDALAE